MLKRLITFVVAALLCGASATVLAQSHGGHSGGMGGGGGGWHGGGGGGTGGTWHGGGGTWHGGGGSWHGGNNWHGGGSNWHGGNWHGGYWNNGRWYGNVSFGLGFPYYWGWPYYYPAYYEPYYAAPAYAPAYSYYPAPNAVYLDSPSGDAQPYQPYAQPQAGQPQARPAPSRGQYYCPDTGYYPTVQACPKGWLRVVPDGPPPQ